MKIFILIFFLTSLVFAPLSAVLAITAGQGPADIQGELPMKSPINEPNQFLDVIASVVKWTYAIFFIITVMFVLFAAFNYLTGGDDAEKIKSAHQQIMYAAIAVAVALLAVGFSLIIQRFLGSSSSSESGSRTQAPAASTQTQQSSPPLEQYKGNYDLKSPFPPITNYPYTPSIKNP